MQPLWWALVLTSAALTPGLLELVLVLAAHFVPPDRPTVFVFPLV